MGVHTRGRGATRWVRGRTQLSSQRTRNRLKLKCTCTSAPRLRTAESTEIPTRGVVEDIQMLQSTTKFSTSRYLGTKDEPERNDTPSVPIQSILYEQVWPSFEQIFRAYCVQRAILMKSKLAKFPTSNSRSGTPHPQMRYSWIGTQFRSTVPHTSII